MRNKVKLLILAVVSVILVSIFMFTEMGNFPAYVLPKRGIKILAIILTGGSIAFSTVIFQTITNNKILTPSIIGLDSLYMLIQTFLIFVFGATSATVMNKNLNFLLCVALMVVFAGLLYKFLFKKEGRNIYFLLLVGLVMGTLFQSFSSFMQVIIDPNDFMVVQDRMFASFNNINTDLLTISFVLVILIGLYFIRFIKIPRCPIIR